MLLFRTFSNLSRYRITSDFTTIFQDSSYEGAGNVKVYWRNSPRRKLWVHTNVYMPSQYAHCIILFFCLEYISNSESKNCSISKTRSKVIHKSAQNSQPHFKLSSSTKRQAQQSMFYCWRAFNIRVTTNSCKCVALYRKF